MKELQSKNNYLKKTPEEIENSILSLLGNIHCKIAYEIFEKYGNDGLEITKKAAMNAIIDLCIEDFKKIKKRDLNTFITWLCKTLAMGHKYEFTSFNENSVIFNFHNCPYADFYKAINKPEIGKIFCDADGPIAKAFNKNIGFKRTKTLMNGDSCCNHQYYYKNSK